MHFELLGIECDIEFNGDIRCMRMRSGLQTNQGNSGRSHCDGAVCVLLFTFTDD